MATSPPPPPAEAGDMLDVRRPEPTVLETPRLRLRPLADAEVDALQRLADDLDIARNTLRVPHPYRREDAEQFFTQQAGAWARGDAAAFAITYRGAGGLIGLCGLHLAHEHGRAELGYWIGREFWGHGYATEAAAAVVRYGFETLRLNRIHAGHYPHNPASGRVLEKIGMRHEGRLRQHVRRFGRTLDMELYGVLRQEFEAPAPLDP
ncbi:MAG: GNAT family N-acetyltransferase [Longimicrobiales bacterium]